MCLMDSSIRKQLDAGNISQEEAYMKAPGRISSTLADFGCSYGTCCRAAPRSPQLNKVTTTPIRT